MNHFNGIKSNFYDGTNGDHKTFKAVLTAVLTISLVFAQFAAASANPLLWPLAPIKAFFSGASAVAEKIAGVVNPPKNAGGTADDAALPGAGLVIPEDLMKQIIEQSPASSAIVTPDDLKNIIALKLDPKNFANAISAEAEILGKKLDALEKLYDDSFVDVAETVAGNASANGPPAAGSDVPNPNALLNKVIDAAPLPKIDFSAGAGAGAVNGQGAKAAGHGQQAAGQGAAATDLVAKLRDQSPNSPQFKSIFEKFREELKPETKSYLEYATDSNNARKILPPDMEIKGGTGVKLWQDKLEDNQLFNRSWTSGGKPGDNIANAYTSNFLNVKDDPSLAQNTLVKSQNQQFNNIRLEQGNTKFGWTHIAFDRPDGTNHAREIKEAFGLKNQDEAVRNFILDTIKNGKAEEQVRERNGAAQHRILYTKTVNGQEIKVVVDNDDKYRGSVITAYPTGKVKIPTPEEIQKKIEDEKKKLAEEAKKGQRWRQPSLSIDFYRNEIGRTIGPQVKAGTESKFRLGGATVSAGAKGDVLLIGAEAKGASYVGVRYGQLAAGVQGSVFAGSRARGDVSTGIQVGKWGGKVMAGGEVSAGVGANADAHVGVGKGGAEASVSGDAFVGVRAKGQVGGTISHGNTSVTGSVNGTVGAGLGAHFEATGKISWTGIKAKVDVGAYLGIGGQLGFDVNVNFGDALKPVQKVVTKVYNEGKKIAQNVGTNIKNTLDNGKKALEKIFHW